MTDSKLEELVRKAARDLGEYFDNVQIFVNWQRDGGEKTAAYQFGIGNIHARIGHVEEWITVQNEFTRMWARDQEQNDE